MDVHDLNQMFDQLSPTPEQEQAVWDRLLHEERKVKPMKKLKKLTVLAIAAALMIGTCAAAVVTGFDQRLADYFGASPEQAELLVPGAVPVNVTMEDNGATLYISQVLMDRYNVMILADFTAPEGTVLDMDEEHDVNRGFGSLDWSVPELLDQAGKAIDLGCWGWQTKVLDDGDPLDNHLTLLMCMELADGIQSEWNVSALTLPAKDLVRYDLERKEDVTIYSGDWSCQFPLTWQDMGQSIQPNQVAGCLDDADITVTEVYLSPMTLQIQLERETPIPLHSDEAEPGLYSRWLSAINSDCVTLSTKEGQPVSLLKMRGTGDNQNQSIAFQLEEITGLEELQTLTLRIGENSVDIPLQ